jgi:hypothetical protein
MSDGFDLDLRDAEEEIDDLQDPGFGDRVVLGVLDGSTDPDEWREEVLSGAVLVLDVTGDLNDLAAPWAADVKRQGGTLMHFREFLVVAPPEVDVDTDRLD